MNGREFTDRFLAGERNFAGVDLSTVYFGGWPYFVGVKKTLLDR